MKIRKWFAIFLMITLIATMMLPVGATQPEAPAEEPAAV